MPTGAYYRYNSSLTLHPEAGKIHGYEEFKNLYGGKIDKKDFDKVFKDVGGIMPKASSKKKEDNAD